MASLKAYDELLPLLPPTPFFLLPASEWCLCIESMICLGDEAALFIYKLKREGVQEGENTF